MTRPRLPRDGRRLRALAIGLVAWMAVANAESQPPAAEPKVAKATFAGGCFWCMEPPYDKVPGVLSTTVGYTGGTTKNPSYQEVSGGTTGHTEAIEVSYDPAKVTYRQLLDIFWKNIDPIDASGQFCDRGSQYRAGIFYHDEDQRRTAEQSKKELQESKKLPGPIVTQIEPAAAFYVAEPYHQNYYETNPLRYGLYRRGCRRDARLEELWGSVPAH